MSKEYQAKDIEVLTGLDPVRRRTTLQRKSLTTVLTKRWPVMRGR